MNAQGKKEIGQHIASLTEIRDRINALKTEEIHEYDNMPEELQESITGERMGKIMELLAGAMDGIYEAICNLRDAQELA